MWWKLVHHSFGSWCIIIILNLKPMINNGKQKMTILSEVQYKCILLKKKKINNNNRYLIIIILVILFSLYL